MRCGNPLRSAAFKTTYLWKTCRRGRLRAGCQMGFRTMRDPYQILGVAKDASQADVKKAFRKLAKQHHPDQNPNDPKSQAKFAEVNSAYEILGDEKKRGAFDRGEIDAEGKPRGFEGFPGGGFRRGGAPGGGPGGFAALRVQFRRRRSL